jgi:ribosome-binding factor A
LHAEALTVSSLRTRRVADQLRALLAELVLRQIHDPRIRGIQITEVRVSPDLRLATVFFSVYAGGPDERRAASEALERASRFLRRAIGRRIRLRVTPALRFLPDDTLERAAHIEEVLATLQAEEPRPAEPAEPETPGPEGEESESSR